MHHGLCRSRAREHWIVVDAVFASFSTNDQMRNSVILLFLTGAQFLKVHGNGYRLGGLNLVGRPPLIHSPKPAVTRPALPGYSRHAGRLAAISAASNNDFTPLPADDQPDPADVGWQVAYRQLLDVHPNTKVLDDQQKGLMVQIELERREYTRLMQLRELLANPRRMDRVERERMRAELAWLEGKLHLRRSSGDEYGF